VRMYALRTGITLLTVCVSAVAVGVVTLLSVLFIRINERRESEQLLLLLCETGKRNLDVSFNSVQTYYYRIDPAVSDTVKGFWYTALDGGDFTEREVTDIARYDTEDTSELVWFTVPKHTGEAIWLPLSNGMRLHLPGGVLCLLRRQGESAPAGAGLLWCFSLLHFLLGFVLTLGFIRRSFRLRAE